MFQYPRGSEWRKWDLHAHTPLEPTWINRASFTSESSKQDFAKEYVRFAKTEGISLIAVTDHNFCNNYDDLLLPYIQIEAERENITILPGFEVTAKDGSGVHILVIFREDSNLRKIQGVVDQLFPPNVEKIPSNGIIPVSNKDLKEIRDKILEAKLDSIFIFAHSDRENGILDEGTITGTRRMQEWHNEFINICQLSKSPSDFLPDTFVSKVINGIDTNYQRRMTHIVASDSRTIDKNVTQEEVNYLGKKFTWIKADTTFDGLKQIIRESNRVYIGDKPPKLVSVEKEKTKYIQKISINKIQSSVIEDKWFDNSLELNTGLIAIIGNKGSGKSALAEIIGLLGNTQNYKHFSFLNDKRFKKKQLASNFEARIIWEDDNEEIVNLNDIPDAWSIERVKCIPQSFIENLCNEFDTKFQDEINNVIFSHINDSARLGQRNLNDLISFKTQVIDKKVIAKQEEMEGINKELVKLENKASEEYKSQVENRLNLIIEELQTHCNIRPKVVEKPPTDTQQSKEHQKLYNELNRSITDIKTLELQIKNTELKEESLNKKIETLKLIKSEILDFITQYSNLKNKYSKTLKDLSGLDFTTLLRLSDRSKPLDAKLKELKDEQVELQKRIKKDFTDKDADNLYFKVSLLKKKNAEIQGKLDEPSKKYQRYLEEFKDWKKIYIDKNKTKKEIRGELKYLKELLSPELEKKKLEREQKVSEILLLLDEKIKVYGELYKPIIKFVQEEKQRWKGSEFLNFTIDKTISLNFKEKFFSFIDRGNVGSFQGIEESEKTINMVIRKYDFSKNDEVLNFLKEIIEKLEKEKVNDKEELRKIDKQLVKGKTKVELYNYLFSLDFIKIDYQLRWGDKLLDDLSPGEKGALLLIFYLLIDRDNIPLIIDQPEENLDNESVYLMLVPYIKEAKARRQLILVTHNPNLAVVCDAEQIIYCKIDKKDKNKISYVTGSIENNAIRAKIIDVLEGTEPAFINRQETYDFK